MTKRDVLIAICEAPGWYPTVAGASIERYLEELHREGWITPRLDGWEATAPALEAYPAFTQPDIVDPRPVTAPEPPAPETVAAERVITLVRCLLEDMPVVSLIRAMAMSPSQLGAEPHDTVAWDIARQLVGQWLAR